jgi:hypothetical protein
VLPSVTSAPSSRLLRRFRRKPCVRWRQDSRDKDLRFEMIIKESIVNSFFAGFHKI